MQGPPRAIEPLATAPSRASWGRLLRTLLHLPPRQIAALAWHRARRLVERPEHFAARSAPPDPGVRWSPGGFPATSPRHDAHALREGRFTFLGRTESLGFPPRWQDPGIPLLWLYNLHYFEYLADLPYEAGRGLILDWIERHPLGRGRVGWAPYPLSLRLASWCAWLFGSQRERVAEDGELRRRVWPSLWLQAEWLSRRVETHLGANHLLENAAALAFCGACFGGPGEGWLARGLRILERELPSQILADGMHYERSPMYHARVVSVLARLAATRHEPLVARVAEPLARARAALARVCHPDGEIALLNDAAFGIAPRPSELLDASLPAGPFALPQAGYYGARAGAHYVVCDAAPVGPEANPGHAHADLLSFEMSLSGHRVVVDAGVHGYDDDPLRAWCRSTRAHNTVEIEGQDQCELWETFRVGRRGRPRDVVWEPLTDGFRLTARHDGYEWMAGRPSHTRAFRWHDDGVLLVRDRIHAGRPVDAVSRLHLHPDCEIEALSGRAASIRHPAGVFRVVFDGEGALNVEASQYCPRFGYRRDARALVFAARGRALGSGFCISLGEREIDYALEVGARSGARFYAWGTEAR